MIKQKFNNDWYFMYGAGGALDSLGGPGAAPEKVQLPHDASVLQPRNPEEPNGSGNGFFHEENYVYTKDFEIDPADMGKIVTLEFEGVYQNAFVYINGSFAAKHPYGYGNFYVDATEYVNPGKNSIKVLVKNGVPSGRWYTGGGIYRDVNLMIADRLYLVPDGIHLATVDLEEDGAVIRAESTIGYRGIGRKNAMLHVELFDAEGNSAAANDMKVCVFENTKKTYRQMLYVKTPHLWDADDPYLYSYKATVSVDGAVTDTETGTFGIRKLQLDVAHGLRVNGKVVKLLGGCIHHDNGIVGTAEFPYTAEYRVKRLKEAGFNAIRSSHYPMSRHLLEAADKLGMYIMDEFADVWTSTKVPFDYAVNMPDWWEYDVTNLVNKDYNHPCVIMYSIGNEIPETGNDIDSEWGKKLADKLRSLDDSRYTTNALNLMLASMDHMGEIIMEEAAKAGISISKPENEGEMPKEINQLMSEMGNVMGLVANSEAAGRLTEIAGGQVDIVGYNYSSGRYEPDHERFPNRILVGSETNPGDLDVNWELVKKLPYVIGDFDWTAYDYLGEAGIGKLNYNAPEGGFMFYSPYPTKAAYCGDVNLIGDFRPVLYWRQTIVDPEKAPVIAVQPPMHYSDKISFSQWVMTNAERSWTYAGWEGKPVIVEVYTGAEEAALYINDVLVEKKKVGEEKKNRALFDTIYQTGKVSVITYTDDKEVGRDEIRSASSDIAMKACAARADLPADGSDIAYADLFLEDGEGILNPQEVRSVTVSVEGPAVIMGYGSADPESEENYYDTTAKTYEGRLRAAIRATGAGAVKVIFSAEGMTPAVVEFKAE